MKRIAPTPPNTPPKRLREASVMTSMDYSMSGAVAPTGTARTSGKRRMIGTRGKGKALSKRQKADVKRILALQQELKYFPFNFVPTTLTNAFVIDGTMFDVPQSATVGQLDTKRIGDSIMWCGTMEVNLQIVNGLGATGDTFNNCRVIILQWHDTSTATPFPVVTQVLLNGPSTVPDIYSTYNHDYRHQYTILFDETYLTVGPNGPNNPPQSNVATGIHKIRINLTKLARKNAQFVAGGGQGSNRFFMIYGSDSQLATHPNMTFASKVFFRDS